MLQSLCRRAADGYLEHLTAACGTRRKDHEDEKNVPVGATSFANSLERKRYEKMRRKLWRKMTPAKQLLGNEKRNLTISTENVEVMSMGGRSQRCACESLIRAAHAGKPTCLPHLVTVVSGLNQVTHHDP
ncbi:unnamed protein product [Heligmosomoides polygyrus]|uniref:POP1 domain-containing protein n=1 Tax=Heligmosomoides polygyrus TaxID=6339 RepID=A0A183FSX4_HELPZ|nr:unnamed protein product [Heligmosomoides polygyrus]